jgi:hypothetical protein
MSEGSPDERFVSQIGVAMAVERLLRAGFHVAVPIVDDGYDLLACDVRRCWRIQVKASSSRGRNRSRIRIGRGQSKREAYDPRHVDAFVLVNTRTSAVMCVPVSETHGRKWFSWLAADKWSDMGVLRRIKTQRC